MSWIVEELQDLADLRIAAQRSVGAAQLRILQVESRMRRRVGQSVSKRVAARALGISVKTLNAWIADGRVDVLADGLVATVPLIDLIVAVETLREAGGRDGVLSAAMEFEEIYGPGLDALARGDVIPATIPATFGPDD